MARLPQPGSDAGHWGDILNDYLRQSLDNAGRLKDGSVSSDTIATGSVTESHLAVNVQAKLNEQPTKSTIGLSNVDNTNDLAKPVSTATQQLLDAKVTLAGDISGSATMPIIPSAYQPRGFNQVASSVKVLSTFQSPHGFSVITVNGSQNNDSSEVIYGTQSLRLLTNGAGNPTTSQRTNITPAIDITNKCIRIRIKVDKPLNVTQLYIYFSSDNVTNHWVTVKPSDYIQVLKPGVWTTLTFSQGRNAQVTGTPILSAINSLAVRVVDDGTTPVSLWINEISTFDQPSTGVVTFTFDDNKISQFTAARPILDRYGYPATVYTIPSRVGQASYMSLGQLKHLQAIGWDIANHTYNHPYLTQLSESAIEAEFYESKRWLLHNGFSKAAGDLALPYGNYNDDTVLRIARKYFRSVRTINHQVETYPAADQYKLRTFYITSTTTLAAARLAVDRAIAHKEWLIFTFHDIESPVSANESWTPSDFDALVSYVNTSNAVVKTLSDVLDGGVSISAPANSVDATLTTKGSVQLAGDLGGSAINPTVIGTHLAAPLPVTQGGTGQSTLTSGNVMVATGSTSMGSTKVAPNGGFVGTSDAQFLTNKTLSMPVISGTVPASSSTTGSTGQIMWGSDHFYVCVATNTWKRVALTSW